MILMKTVVKFSLKKLVGKHYTRFWNFKGRYRVIKGSRASKKSKTTALNFITRLMEYPEANLLVVRKVEKTLRDSCCADLIWAIYRLGVQDLWDFPTKPTSKLEITYKPTGQKILFRGLDDPLKVTSVSVEKGVLCWMWIEEAYEIMKESDFDMLDESIRGEVPEGLFKQITLTLNPWNEKHWIKKRFFGEIIGKDNDGKPIYKFYDNWINPDNTIMALTTNYLMNEFLDDDDRKVFETMKINNPRRYAVAGLGGWGIVEGLIYENWKEESFDVNDILKISGIKSAFGLDFGYTNDPSALFCGLVDLTHKKIYVFDEMYKKGMSNEAIHTEVTNMGYSKEKIKGDSSEPKSIDRLRELGLSRISGARKGKDSINNGIDFIQDFEIIIHPKCVNFITEISNYTWDKDKFDKVLNKPIDDFNHLMDAMRYALEDFVKGDSFSFD